MRKKKNLNTVHIKLDTHLCKACWKCYDACKKDVFGKINIRQIFKFLNYFTKFHLNH